MNELLAEIGLSNDQIKLVGVNQTHSMIGRGFGSISVHLAGKFKEGKRNEVIGQIMRIEDPATMGLVTAMTYQQLGLSDRFSFAQRMNRERR